MKSTRALALFGFLAILAAGALEAQSPPYGGYNPAPPYYSVGPYQGTSMYCSNFVIKQGTTVLLQNASGAATTPYHTYYGAVTPANIVPAGAYTIEVTMAGSYPTYATCWIDYNNDGDFLDTSEYLGQSTTSASAGVVSLSFTVPTGFAGVKRLRMRTNYSTPATHPTNTYSYGESEDYLVNLGFAIETASPLAAGAQGIAYSVDIVATNGVTPYNWQGSPTYLVSGSLPAGLTASPLGNALRISGTPTGTGTSNFTVSVNDSATPTPKNSTKAFQITIFPPPASLPFSDNFSTDKGWALTGAWVRATPIAYTGSGPNRTLPGQDHTQSGSNMVLAYANGTDYGNNLAASVWATSPPINCSTGSPQYIRLRFWSWSGFSPSDEGTIQVSNNGGSSWITVLNKPDPITSTFQQNTWTSMYVDISNEAAGYAVVQVRIGVGPTNASIVNVGWCIDDLLIEQPTADMFVEEQGPSGGPTPITSDQAVGGARDFGQVGVSQNSAPLSIYIENKGPTNITFSGNPVIAKTGAQPNDFYINASSLTNPLPVGAQTSFTVTFYRTTAGISTATLEIVHNAAFSGTSPFKINLRGEAIVPNPIIQVNLGSQTGPQINHGDPAAGTPRDFGNQDVGAGPTAAITLFVTNAGTGTLTLNAPYMGGTWWTEYVINSAGMTGQLTAGQSTSFTVAFDPTSIGQKPAIVQIPFAGGTQLSPFQIPVTGNGISSGGPTLKVHEGPVTGPQIQHDAQATGTYRDFGNVMVGQTSAAKTITIENSGGAAMTLGMPTLAGTNPGEFALTTAGFLTSLTPGQSTSFDVAFAPTSVGVKIAQITFTHNDTNVTSPFIINVRGTGVTTAPAIVVRETNAVGTQIFNQDPASGNRDFGTQDITAGPTTPATIYVANTGTAALTLGIPSFQSPTTEFQLQVSGFAGSLAPGSSAQFTITFDPTAVGTHTATVQFTQNDSSAGTPFEFDVTGDAVLNAPQLEVREGTTIGPIVSSGDPALGTGRDCGSTPVGSNQLPVTVVIMNTGTQNLNMGTPTLGGNNASEFVLITSGFNSTVAPGANTQLSVGFNPTLAGIKDCTVQFTHDDPAAPIPFVLNFVGTATDPTAVLITTPSLPAAIPDMSYGPMQIEAIQGTTPYVWSIYSGNLPNGMSLNSAGVLGGTPTGFGGTYNVIVRVQDQTGATNEKLYTIVVSGDLSGRGKADSGSCTADSGGSTGLALLALLAAAIAGVRVVRRRA